MAKEKKIKPVSLRKQTRLQTIDQLNAALPVLKELLGKKEFGSRIKKAARALTQGIKVKKEKSAKEKVSRKNKITGKLK